MHEGRSEFVGFKILLGELGSNLLKVFKFLGSPHFQGHGATSNHAPHARRLAQALLSFCVIDLRTLLLKGYLLLWLDEASGGRCLIVDQNHRGSASMGAKQKLALKLLADPLALTPFALGTILRSKED
ncbi:hypothetical protein VNO77_18907 [Canavalia gladiata]|uniref:Uncharacterized protein n=1 Tax=Canavalia gladiata TaxID=3824 RepID=A0AAN9LQK5_CANGL